MITKKCEICDGHIPLEDEKGMAVSILIPTFCSNCKSVLKAYVEAGSKKCEPVELKPIFSITTHDGKIVKEGEKVYSCLKRPNGGEQILQYYVGGKIFDIDKRYFFSAKQACHEYIEENKPKYSKVELDNAIELAKLEEPNKIYLVFFRGKLYDTFVSCFSSKEDAEQYVAEVLDENFIVIEKKFNKNK